MAPIKSGLRDDEEALLELLSMRPLGYLPAVHKVMADGLRRRGLVSRNGETWHATTSGELLLHWEYQARTVGR